MQIEIKIDNSCTEPKIIVVTDKMTEHINNIVKRITETSSQLLSGFKDEMLEVLDQADLIRIYANAGKVIAVTNKGEYLLRLRLYEVEERLDDAMFVRISNSEIVNLKKVKTFDLNMVGTICVSLQNGTVTYVSRRYVSKIKIKLGI
jgi:DNA-binding LytR/AlgR family response regulator